MGRIYSYNFQFSIPNIALADLGCLAVVRVKSFEAQTGGGGVGIAPRLSVVGLSFLLLPGVKPKGIVTPSAQPASGERQFASHPFGAKPGGGLFHQTPSKTGGIPRVSSSFGAHTMRNSKLVLKACLIRAWLQSLPFVSEVSGIKETDDYPTAYVEATVRLDEPVKIRVPISKLGLKLVREISQHWIPGMLIGSIKWHDVAVMLTVFSSARTVFKYRTKIRKKTGLVRYFREHAIARRIYCTKKMRGERK